MHPSALPSEQQTHGNPLHAHPHPRLGYPTGQTRWNASWPVWRPAPSVWPGWPPAATTKRWTSCRTPCWPSPSATPARTKTSGRWWWQPSRQNAEPDDPVDKAPDPNEPEPQRPRLLQHLQTLPQRLFNMVPPQRRQYVRDIPAPPLDTLISAPLNGHPTGFRLSVPPRPE